jgi:hypothetical protein
MATLITAFIVFWLLTLPFRIAMRRARQRVVAPQVIVVVQQQPAVPAPLLTLEQELERLIEGSR